MIGSFFPALAARDRVKREVTQELSTTHSLVGFDGATRPCARAPFFLGSYTRKRRLKTALLLLSS